MIRDNPTVRSCSRADRSALAKAKARNSSLARRQRSGSGRIAELEAELRTLTPERNRAPHIDWKAVAAPERSPRERLPGILIETRHARARFLRPLPVPLPREPAPARAVRDLDGVEVPRCTTPIQISTSTLAPTSPLERAEIVVWQHPIFWYSVPGLLKHCSTRGVGGFAYGDGGVALRGKPANGRHHRRRASAFTPQAFPHPFVSSSPS